jgi:hypothetical protein
MDKIYEVYGVSILTGEFKLVLSTDDQDLAVETYREYIRLNRRPRLFECFDEYSIVI